MAETQINSWEEVPEEIKEDFKKDDKNADFKVDEFEDLIMQDIIRSDEDTKIKLNRDLTNYFHDWMVNKLEKKENISVNIRGQTRSGKSLVGLRVMDVIYGYYNKDFLTDYLVCANQKEFRQKLQKTVFGDGFLIDENQESNVGIGSQTEEEQLKDIQNIIAKQNIHTVYITPRQFLSTNAEIGLAYWGKDTKNWTSRFLLYSLKGGNPILLGYITVDVGMLFKKHGCLLYKTFGGCTNPERKTIDDIKKEHLDYSFGVPKEYSQDQLRCDGVCPLYDLCNHPMARYEKKKDEWINKEMTGGMDERTQERFSVAMKLAEQLMDITEDGSLKIKAKNGKDLKVKVDTKLPLVTNTKFTVTETERVLDIFKSLTDMDTFVDTCKHLKLDPEKQLEKIRTGVDASIKEEEEEENSS